MTPKNKLKQDDEVLKGVSGDVQLEYLKKCCYYLIAVAHDTNSNKSTFTWKGVTFKDKKLGDWEIIVKKKK